jgi:hypothetical protein
LHVRKPEDGKPYLINTSAAARGRQLSLAGLATRAGSAAQLPAWLHLGAD